MRVTEKQEKWALGINSNMFKWLPLRLMQKLSISNKNLKSKSLNCAKNLYKLAGTISPTSQHSTNQTTQILFLH